MASPEVRDVPIQLAYTVDVALVLDVVVGPREAGLRLGECRDRVDRQLAGAELVARVALHVLDGVVGPHAVLVLVADSGAVVGL